MEKNEFSGEYLAPKVKVVEMHARQQMLTGSDNGFGGETQKYDDGGDWVW